MKNDKCSLIWRVCILIHVSWPISLYEIFSLKMNSLEGFSLQFVLSYWVIGRFLLGMQQYKIFIVWDS